MQTFSKSLKKRARLSSVSKTFHPRFFLRKRKERERETVPDPASSPASNRIKSNHDRETVIRISTSVPFSTFFLPLLRNTRQDVSRGQCGIPPRSGEEEGSLSELRVPFMHQKTSSDDSTVASYPFVGARTRSGLREKRAKPASVTRTHI